MMNDECGVMWGDGILGSGLPIRLSKGPEGLIATCVPGAGLAAARPPRPRFVIIHHSALIILGSGGPVSTRSIWGAGL